MSSYKDSSLIPGAGEPAEDTRPNPQQHPEGDPALGHAAGSTATPDGPAAATAEGPRQDPHQEAPTGDAGIGYSGGQTTPPADLPSAGLPTAEAEQAPGQATSWLDRRDPAAGVAAGETYPDEGATEPRPFWSTGWAVTEVGLESRYVRNGIWIPSVVEPERLLCVQPGTVGVADLAVHLAEKGWLAGPEELVAAYGEALRIHHPGQAVIDMRATAEAVRRAWARCHPPGDRPDEPLGYHYVPGEPILRRLQREAATDSTAPAAHESRPEPWIRAGLNRIEKALARHGVDPAADSAGLDINARVAAMALNGATDAEIAAEADRLKHEHVIEPDESDEEPPPEFDFRVEFDIEGAIEERHRLRGKKEGDA